MSDKYTNNELGLLMQSMVAKIDQFMSDSREQIKELKEENHNQHFDMLNTLKEHNGRLGKAEKWQERAKGGAIIASVLIIPFTGWYIFYTQNLLGKTVETQSSIKAIETKVISIEKAVEKDANIKI